MPSFIGRAKPRAWPLSVQNARTTATLRPGGARSKVTRLVALARLSNELHRTIALPCLLASRKIPATATALAWLRASRKSSARRPERTTSSCPRSRPVGSCIANESRRESTQWVAHSQLVQPRSATRPEELLVLPHCDSVGARVPAERGRRRAYAPDATGRAEWRFCWSSIPAAITACAAPLLLPETAEKVRAFATGQSRGVVSRSQGFGRPSWSFLTSGIPATATFSGVSPQCGSARSAPLIPRGHLPAG
jgi:hypothetical protein